MKFDLQKFNSEFQKRVILLFSLFIIVDIIANIPSLNLFVDIFSHFKVQYFHISILFFFFFIYFSYFYKKYVAAAIISILLIFVNYFEMSNYCGECFSAVQSDIKLGLFNVLTDNKHYDKLFNEISLKNPDIVILQEVNDVWLNNIKPLKNSFPYFIDHPRDDNFGMSLYSKYPLKNSDIEFWTDYYVPVIRAQIEIKGKAVTIYCVHTLPPVSNDYLSARNKMLEKISKILNDARRKENVIIAGDFNTTVFSPAYKRFIDSSLNSHIVYDAIRYAPKIEGTWNAFHPPIFRITLEHILTVPTLRLKMTEIGNNIGSDHLPVFAEFAFKE